MAVIEPRPPGPHAVRIVDPVDPPALRIVKAEGVFSPLRPPFRRRDPLRRDPDPIAASKLKLQAVKAQQHFEFVIDLGAGHKASYQDWMREQSARAPGSAHDPGIPAAP